ncbi:hypothetical protein ACHAXA_004407 [Cyclostephanos tholiformis]|uniref:Uncharacterized protein n=1 Tax=Cyclostephanos tholiformis TaxID=382380 RepID=A0ABD3RFF1_9STRA
MHQNNAHISNSSVSDNLLWRDIVNCTLRRYVQTGRRWDAGRVGQSRLVRLGDELTDLLEAPTMLEESRVGDACGNSGGYDEVVRGDSEVEAENKQRAIDDYRQYLDERTRTGTVKLRTVVDSLKECPMDVTMLTETGIGKKSDGEMRELLGGIRILEYYAVDMERKHHPQQDGGTGADYDREYIHRDAVGPPRADIARLEGHGGRVTTRRRPPSSCASPPPPSNKKRNMTENEDEDQGYDFSNCIVTCGRKNVTTHQHRLDMRLLHSSSTWRSFTIPTRTRVIVRRSHGDRVRSRREGLEKDRPKVGKVVLRSAVGRVRGGDNDGRNGGGNSIPPPRYCQW